MNIEYILYVSIVIVCLAMFSLLYALYIAIKRKLVNRAINKFSIHTFHPITHRELDNFMGYIEKNKKYLSDSTYKIGMYKVKKIRTHIK